ncbi:MAG: hypothetical protein ACKN9P_14990, partial [Phenylobacterium sp.]
ARVGATLQVLSDTDDRRKLFGALLAMFVGVPALALFVVRAGDLPGPAAAALLAASISPIAPFLPRKQWKVGGDPEWVTALQVTATILSVVLAPLFLAIVNRIYGLSVEAPVASMLTVLCLTVLAPLALGMGIQTLSPQVASRLAGPLGLVGTLLLAAVAVLILVGMWPALLAGAAPPLLPACLVLSIVGVFLGHRLTSGPRSDRTASAMAAVSRHPGVAIILASAALGGTQAVLVADVLLFVLVATLVLAAYQFLLARLDG